jgi:3-isopropylmalate/(R)-2-methylmalate dehydratase small subunit
MYGNIHNMKKFTTISSRAFYIPVENIDTDQIIPARFLKTTKRVGLGIYLFNDLKNINNKQVINYFHNLNYQSNEILISGKNFGCGSSREHAVWTLMDFGIQVIIAPSFGDIFYTNALKNGLLPIRLTQKEYHQFETLIRNNTAQNILVDLLKQNVEIYSSKQKFHFNIDPFSKTCLVQGIDELGYLLTYKKLITAFEKTHIIY